MSDCFLGYIKNGEALMVYPVNVQKHLFLCEL